MPINSPIESKTHIPFGSNASSVAWIFAVLAAYLLTRPYVGIYHDSMFYTVQALLLSGHDALGQDIVFQYGNQGRFSIFPSLQGWLIAELGLGPSLKVLRLVSSVIWLFGLVMLARAIFPAQRYWLIAVILTCLLCSKYGYGAMAYGEGYVTSRPFAEGFCMLAISSALRGKLWLGLVAMLISGAFHPLVAVTGGSIWLLVALGMTVKTGAVCALCAGSLLIAGYAGYAPANWIFETHDAEWGRLIRDYETLGFMSGWGWVPVQLHALQLVVLILAAVSGDQVVARLARAVLVATACLIALGLIGADLMGNRLVTSLQLWRVLGWLMLVGNVLALHLLLTLKPGGAVWTLLLIALAANVIETLINSVPLFSSVLAVLLLFARGLELKGLFGTWVQAFTYLAATVIIAALCSYIFIANGATVTTSLTRIAIAGMTVAALVLPGRAVPIGMSAIAVAGSLLLFDARSPTLRFVESTDPIPQSLTEKLASNTVYWENGLELMWFKMRQPQYYSCHQRAGALFFRGQAMEHERRADILAPLNASDFNHISERSCRVGTDRNATGPEDADALIEVCQNAEDLDFVVLNEPVPNVELPQFNISTGDMGLEVFLVDCSEFR